MLRVTSAFILALALVAAPAAATQHSQNETGEDNEFGSVRAPYQLTITGEPLVVEARVALNTYYEDQKAAFFMFAWDTQNSPALGAKFLSLQTADGQDIEVTEVQTETNLVKWFVDIEDMPPVGSTIVMKAELTARSKGFFSVGAMVVPFTYRWENVMMTSGQQAKLYGFTQVGVNKETGAGSGGGGDNPPRFVPPGGGKLPVPGLDVALVAAALGAAALAVGARGRRRA